MPSKPSTTVSAVHKLELSRLTPGAMQRELMGSDINVPKLAIYLGSKIKTDLGDRITRADISRSIEAASTLTITVNDYDRSLLVSGLLNSKLDVKIDGLWFRLNGVDKAGDELTLTFQDREIGVLRGYSKFKIARRSKVTRAEFILNLIREVKEFKIPVVIPELHKVQPVETYVGDISGSDPSLSKNKGLPAPISIPDNTPGQVRSQLEQRKIKVKGVPATRRQITTANQILGAGENMNVKRKLEVCAIMVAIQESTLGMAMHNGDATGTFQQMPSWGSYEDRMNTETAARTFFNHAVAYDRQYPNAEYYEVCEGVQISGEPQKYIQWRSEAEKIVTAYGSPGGSDETDVNSSNTSGSPSSPNGQLLNKKGEFFFWRGTIKDQGTDQIMKPENSWSCIIRLAHDVNFRAFFVSGVFYYISDDQLFKQRPQFTLTEFADGIMGIDGGYQQLSKNATLTVTARTGRWMVPPGCVVMVEGMGPWNGRWLVSEYSRSLFDLTATVTLVKPMPMLPEPLTGNETDLKNVQGAPIPNTGGTPKPGEPGSDVPLPTKGLINAILSSPKITWSNPSLQRNDIKTGQISKEVMSFMMWLVNGGYTYTVTSLKSDHNTYTTGGRVSAHSQGRAIDIGAINGVGVLGTGVAAAFMDILKLNHGLLGFAQLIGPYPSKCIPLGIYDAHTLDEHKDHVHVGW